MARGAKKIYGLAGEVSAFFPGRCLVMQGGFPEEMACTPTAFTVHSGGHFFPLNRGPPLSPGPLSRARPDMSFLSGLRTMHSAALACQRVWGGELPLFTNFSVAPKCWNPQFPGPPSAQPVAELKETPQ